MVSIVREGIRALALAWLGRRCQQTMLPRVAVLEGDGCCQLGCRRSALLGDRVPLSILIHGGMNEALRGCIGCCLEPLAASPMSVPLDPPLPLHLGIPPQ